MAKKTMSAVKWFDMAETPYRASRLFKTLGNPKVYALIGLLLKREVLSVEEMSDLLERMPWAVSKMLRPLRDLDVVRYQRSGRSSLYRLKDEKLIRALLRNAEEFVSSTRKMQ